jgi:hypothetical protein
MYVLILILLTSLSFAQDEELRESVSRMDSIGDLIESLNEQECPPEETQAFGKVTSGIPVACASGETREGYEEMKVVDCTRDGKIYPGGFRFRAQAGHPLIAERSPYPNGGKPGRVIEFWSRDGALNETFLYLNDTAGGPDSHDMKSAMFILPRKVVPSVRVNGNDVEMTMTTGEKVVFDKKTSAIKSGALREGPSDLSTDRFRRQPANVHYDGSGISVRLNHRYLDPRLSGETAEIKQGTKVCRVPRTVFFDNAGMLKSQSDAQFIRTINQSCPNQGFRI